MKIPLRLFLTQVIFSTPFLTFGQAGQDGESVYQLDPFTVQSTNRSFPSDSASEISRFYSDDIISTAAWSIDGLLTADPRLSAYRRTESISAHPSTQGVRFRNVATNASSRALVILDGVPQNDPFGGYVFWQRVPRFALSEISLVPAGSPVAWGDLGGGGLISLLSVSPFEDRFGMEIGAGSFGTREASMGASVRLSENWAADFDARHFDTDGFWVLREEDRGAVDTPAASDSTFARSRLAWRQGDDLHIVLSGSWFKEDKVNGTQLAVNGAEARDVDLRADWSPEGALFRWMGVVYYQDRDFYSTYTSVEDDRNDERVALDQFDVPADALGVSLIGTLETSDLDTLQIGADGRWIEGEVNELFRNLGAGFTRSRVAGGEQSTFGFFGNWRREWTSSFYSELTLRGDRVKDSNGFRKETDTTTDIVLSDVTYGDDSDWEPSASFKVGNRFSDAFNVSVQFSRGFRNPTLNERYRPYRVKNDIVEANPVLDRESIQGGELTLEWTPTKAVNLYGTLYYYEMDDMVTNVYLFAGPGSDPVAGFIPDGGSLSQRLSVSGNSVRGFELGGDLALGDWIGLGASYMFADSRFGPAPSGAGEEFEGNQFPLSPEHQFTVRVDVAPKEDLNGWIEWRYWSESFEDAINTREVSAESIFSLGLSYRISDHLRLYGVVDNVFDSEIMTGLSSSDLVSIGAGRSGRLSLAVTY